MNALLVLRDVCTIWRIFLYIPAVYAVRRKNKRSYDIEKFLLLSNINNLLIQTHQTSLNSTFRS